MMQAENGCNLCSIGLVSQRLLQFKTGWNPYLQRLVPACCKLTPVETCVESAWRLRLVQVETDSNPCRSFRFQLLRLKYEATAVKFCLFSTCGPEAWWTRTRG